MSGAAAASGGALESLRFRNYVYSVKLCAVGMGASKESSVNLASEQGGSVGKKRLNANNPSKTKLHFRRYRSEKSRRTMKSEQKEGARILCFHYSRLTALKGY
jgi:hypothetical protein